MVALPVVTATKEGATRIASPPVDASVIIDVNNQLGLTWRAIGKSGPEIGRNF